MSNQADRYPFITAVHWIDLVQLLSCVKQQPYVAVTHMDPQELFLIISYHSFFVVVNPELLFTVMTSAYLSMMLLGG